MRYLKIGYSLLNAGLVFLMMSCTGNDEETSPATVAKSNVMDTLIIGGITYSLQTTDSLTHYRLAAIMEDTMTREIIDDTAHVKRNGRTLIFRLTTGVDSVLVDDTTESAEMISYRYRWKVEDANSWLIFGALYEGFSYILVNRDNAEKVWCSSPPLFSADRRKFICFYEEHFASYIFNGIELFEINNGKVEQRWQRYLTGWGPADVRWKDDHTISIRQKFVWPEEPSRDSTVYKLMDFQQK